MYYGSSQHGIQFSFLFIMFFWGIVHKGEKGRVYGHSNVTSDCEIAHVLLDFSKEGVELTNYSWEELQLVPPTFLRDKDLSNCWPLVIMGWCHKNK